MKYKKDFPVLQQRVHDKPLVFLDSAASGQQPKQVIEAVDEYVSYHHANIHRGVYELSDHATHLYEDVRHKVQHFINAKYPHEIIFVSGTTAAINLVAQCFAKMAIKANDEIIVSTMEHHSNIVPWQMVCEQYGAILKIIPMTDKGELDLTEYKNLFSPRTKIVAVSHASNVLGTIHPIKEMTEIAHAHKVPILIDGAQGFPHLALDVRELDCDFYAFSAHKAYGPTGIGVLYAKDKFLNAMPPYQGGGGMIETVSFTKTTYAKAPNKFEAGTPNIAGAIGLGAAIDYLAAIGMHNIFQHESALLRYAEKQLTTIDGLRILGEAKHKVGVVSFVLDDIHPHDIGTVLDHQGVCVRAGHHCAMPLIERLQIPACVRASFGIYNEMSDVDALVNGLKTVKTIFR